MDINAQALLIAQMYTTQESYRRSVDGSTNWDKERRQPLRDKGRVQATKVLMSLGLNPKETMDSEFLAALEQDETQLVLTCLQLCRNTMADRCRFNRLIRIHIGLDT